MLDADLTDLEINNMCHPLRQNAAKVKFLRSMNPNLIVRVAYDGRPLVNRAHYDAITGGARTAKTAESNSEPTWTVPA